MNLHFKGSLVVCARDLSCVFNPWFAVLSILINAFFVSSILIIFDTLFNYFLRLQILFFEILNKQGSTWISFQRWVNSWGRYVFILLLDFLLVSSGFILIIFILISECVLGIKHNNLRVMSLVVKFNIFWII